MAHNVETMAYAGETPWHGLGKRVLPDLTPDQMLKEAQLDWTVSKTPVFYESDFGEHEIPNKYALIRDSDGSFLTEVSSSWKPLQNHEAFKFFNDFVEVGDMEMHTAGSLQNGKIVWALAKFKDQYFEVFPEDNVEQYLLFVNPHKRGQAIEVRSTQIRVVCNNTMNFALQNNSSKRITVNHNQKWDEQYIKNMLGLAYDTSLRFKEQAMQLACKSYTMDELIDYYKYVFPTASEELEMSKNAEEALEVIKEQPGSSFGEGTWWQAFNAVTYMTDHTLGKARDSRLSSAWFGTNKVKKEKALNKALEYAT